MKQKISVPNYLYPLLIEIDELPTGAIAEICIQHDPGCAHWNDRPCDCTPDVRIMAVAGVLKH